MTGPGKCARCGHAKHAAECTRLGSVTCRPLPGVGLVRGRFLCGCTYAGSVQADAKVCTCGQALAWALTQRGRPMPVERGSANAPDGTLAVWQIGGRLYCRVLRTGEEPRPGEWRGRAHWGRCADEGAHRQGGTR
jgi:hypothetical protein